MACRALFSPYALYGPPSLAQAFAYSVAVSSFLNHCRSIYCYRQSLFKGQKDGGQSGERNREKLEHIAGHWTPVASSDIYTETARLIVDTQFLVLFVYLSATLMGTCAQLRTEYMQLHYSGTDDSEPRDAMCCAGDSCSQLCSLGVHWMVTLVTLSNGLAACLQCNVMFIPWQLWSPLVKKAMEKTNNYMLGRLLLVNWLSLGLIAVNVILVSPYMIKRLSPVEVRFPTKFYEAFFICISGAILVELTLLLWCLGPANMWRRWSVLFSEMLAWLRRRLRGTQVNPLPQAGHSASNVLLCRQSWRYRQLVLLSASTYTFAIDVSSSAIPYELWILRVILLGLLAMSRDRASSFDDIQDLDNVGFGLVVNARELRLALEAHVQDRPYLGHINTYKATMLRMEDTMAISYRWQEISHRICHQPSAIGRTGLNMSKWQERAVVEAIKTTRCSYVWLDVCSVPQEATQSHVRIKKVLLTRMMAAYSSAFVTLVLLSNERVTQRYHQRTWTLQEYCASQRLLVVRQKETPAEANIEESEALCAVQGSEGRMVRQLRYEHLLRQPFAMPVWLSNGVEGLVASTSTEDAQQIWRTYNTLAEKLHCLYPADSVRALYPLLWNRPAESEAELMSLIQAVETVHSIPQKPILKLLRSNSASASAGHVSRIAVQEAPS